MSMGSASTCGWDFNYLGLPTSMDGEYTTYYQEDGPWQSYLASLDTPNSVIISTDLEASACDGSIGVGYIQVQAGGFTYNEAEVQPSALASTVQAAGQAHQIVTAVAYDDAQSPPQVVVISYGWSGDTTTVYESQAVAIPASGNVGSTAQSLAGQGYFVSAFGGNSTDGYVMVGMRVQGDTMPRPLDLGNGSSVTSAPDDAYWSVVAHLGGFISEQ